MSTKTGRAPNRAIALAVAKKLKGDVITSSSGPTSNAISASSNSREAAEILLDRAQVATVPGVVFGEHGEGHLRFSFSTSLETIEAGLESLRRNL